MRIRGHRNYSQPRKRIDMVMWLLEIRSRELDRDIQDEFPGEMVDLHSVHAFWSRDVARKARSWYGLRGAKYTIRKVRIQDIPAHESL